MGGGRVQLFTFFPTEHLMIKWIVILLVVAVIAGALGFRGVAGAAYNIAFFLVAMALALVAVVLLLFAWPGGGLV